MKKIEFICVTIFVLLVTSFSVSFFLNNNDGVTLVGFEEAATPHHLQVQRLIPQRFLNQDFVAVRTEDYLHHQLLQDFQSAYEEFASRSEFFVRQKPAGLCWVEFDACRVVALVPPILLELVTEATPLTDWFLILTEWIPSVKEKESNLLLGSFCAPNQWVQKVVATNVRLTYALGDCAGNLRSGTDWIPFLPLSGPSISNSNRRRLPESPFDRFYLPASTKLAVGLLDDEEPSPCFEPAKPLPDGSFTEAADSIDKFYYSGDLSVKLGERSFGKFHGKLNKPVRSSQFAYFFFLATFFGDKPMELPHPPHVAISDELCVVLSGKIDHAVSATMRCSLMDVFSAETGFVSFLMSGMHHTMSSGTSLNNSELLCIKITPAARFDDDKRRNVVDLGRDPVARAAATAVLRGGDAHLRNPVGDLTVPRPGVTLFELSDSQALSFGYERVLAKYRVYPVGFEGRVHADDHDLIVLNMSPGNHLVFFNDDGVQVSQLAYKQVLIVAAGTGHAFRSGRSNATIDILFVEIQGSNS